MCDECSHIMWDECSQIESDNIGIDTSAQTDLKTCDLLFVPQALGVSSLFDCYCDCWSQRACISTLIQIEQGDDIGMLVVQFFHESVGAPCILLTSDDESSTESE